MSLTHFSDAASGRHNDIILLPAIHRVSGNDFMFQQDSASAHHAVCVQELNCCIKKHQTFLRSTCGLQTAHISPCSIVSTTDKSIVSMNLNGGSLMSGVALNTRLLTRLLTSGDEDIERVSMLKEDI